MRIPIGIQPGGTRIQAVQQPVQWVATAFSFTSSGAVPFTQTGSTKTQQPEVKYNFSLHDPNDVCSVPEFEYQEQSNNDKNVKGRLKLHLDFWKSIGAYENIIDTIYNG